MLTIKVLGPGCPNCKKLEAIAQQAATETGLAAEIVKVTDYVEIAQYDILSTPGLVVNDRVVSSGRIPSAAEVRAWLANAAQVGA